MPGQNDPAAGSDDSFLDNHDKLKASLTNATIAGLISAADQATINADNTDMHGKKSASDIADAAAQQATKDKDTSIDTGRSHYRSIRQRFMKATGYTPALGELAGVERDEPNTPSGFADTSAPTLKGRALDTGGAEIKSNKDGAEAVDIYSERDGSGNYTFLMRVLRFPWMDSRPVLVAGKPEERNYRGQFVRKGQPSGNMSAAITIIVRP